jgi:hypothetical protein
MATIKTNFYKISISPPADTLYVSAGENPDNLVSHENVTTRLTKDSLVSLHPRQSTRPMPAEPWNIQALVKRLFFARCEASEWAFDVDYREGSMTILPERIAQHREHSILRRVATRLFFADKVLLPGSY